MDEAVSVTERNTCTMSYLTANPRPMEYLILKVIRK
jgi:hypothetical protein